MRDDLILALAAVLAEAIDDPHAHLAAAMIASKWSLAFGKAQKGFDRSRDPGKATRNFLALIDRRAVGTAAALSGIAYV